MEGAGAYFHVVGLQQRAALGVPIVLQAQDDLLKDEHRVCPEGRVTKVRRAAVLPGSVLSR